MTDNLGFLVACSIDGTPEVGTCCGCGGATHATIRGIPAPAWCVHCATPREEDDDSAGRAELTDDEKIDAYDGADFD